MGRIVRMAAVGCKAAAVVAFAPVILLAHVAKWLDTQDSVAGQRTELASNQRRTHPKELGGNTLSQAA